jgi:hypothetical protein
MEKESTGHVFDFTESVQNYINSNSYSVANPFDLHVVII